MTSQKAYLKDFQKTFDSLSSRHGYYNIFEDYLDMFINGFSFNYSSIDLQRLQNKYSTRERHLFGDLIQLTIKILDTEITSDTCWHDFFGAFYEQASLSKQKGFAQYFTPEPICQFMAQIILDQTKRREYFYEPAAGSGRFSLAANSQNFGMFHFLVDKDFTCAKMSALNLLFHGIDGIVICDDGLFPGNSFRGAFITNRKLHYTGVPEIEYTDNVNVAYNYVNQRVPNKKATENILETEKQHSQTLEPETLQNINAIIDQKGQYSLF